MNSHEIVAKVVLQWQALHLAEARLEKCLFEQELAKMDKDLISLIKDNDKLIGKGDGKYQVTNLVVPSIRREVLNFEAQDPLIEVNLGTVDESRQTKISGLLSRGECDQLV